MHMYMLGNDVYFIRFLLLESSLPTVPPNTGKRESLTDDKHFVN